MEGFFFDQSAKPEKEKVARIRKEKTQAAFNCQSCGLFAGCKNPKMDWTGEGQRKILVIAEAPGAEEDDQNTQLIGRAGQLLRNKFQQYKINIDRDCWKINAINCRPPENRTPKEVEIKSCFNVKVKPALEELKPQHVFLFGTTAIESFYCGREIKDTSLATHRGYIIPDLLWDCWVYPIYHPNYVLRCEWDKAMSMIFDEDIKSAIRWIVNFEHCPSHIIQRNSSECIKILKNFEEVVDVLKRINEEGKPTAIDYETNMLKPFHRDATIRSVSICNNFYTAYAFLFDDPHWNDAQYKEIIGLWYKILHNLKIGKIAHNILFEESWSLNCLDTIVAPWKHDTMLAAHVLDNRRDCTSLDMQCHLHFGVDSYDTIKQYKKAKDGEIENTIFDAPVDDLLLYGGLDALYCYRLFAKQDAQLKARPRLVNAFRFWMASLLTMGQIHQAGIRVKQGYYAKTKKELGVKINQIKSDLEESEEARVFLDTRGHELKISSNKDIQDLLFAIYGNTPAKSTAKGNASVDDESLSAINSPFAKKLLEWRSLNKLVGTYLTQHAKESYENVMHPFFHLHTVTTYRSSSSDPNFQNVPKRDETSKKYIRQAIIPRQGHKLLEFDYSAIEVRVIACLTKDKEILRYIREGGDMHSDLALDCFEIEECQLTDELRSWVKNKFVFPAFYGSYYAVFARDLWETCMELKLKTGEKVKNHLGMTYRDFEAHIKDVEKRFWKKYNGVRTWQNDLYATYLKKGTIETPFGFEFSGHMKKNDLYNYPIQGTAFHLLTWTLNNLIPKMRERDFNSSIIAQIHDAGLLDLEPTEQEIIIPLIEKIATQDIRKTLDWIIVPLEVKFEITEIDGDWSTLKKLNREIK